MTVRTGIWIIFAAASIISVILILKGNKKSQKILAVLSVVLSFISFSAGFTIPEEVLSKNIVDVLHVNSLPPEEIYLYIGEEAVLSFDSDTATPISWTSDNRQVAVIDATGKVTALYEGNTTITVVDSHNKKLAAWTLSVISPSVELSDSSKKLYIGDTYLFHTKTYPSELAVVWESSNPDIATVDDSGELWALAVGSTLISAKVNFAGRAYKMTCQITVEAPSVSFSNNTVELARGDSKQLLVNTVPNMQNITWISSDPSIVTVNGDGTVTECKEGTATITASVIYNGVTYSDHCTVNVVYTPIEISEIYRMTTSHGGFYSDNQVTDIYGNIWAGPCYYAVLDGFNGYQDGTSSELYYTQGQYTQLSGTIVLPSDQYNTYYTSYLKVYGDGRLLYTSPGISYGFAPQDFKVDITGVSELEIALGGHWTLLATDCRPRIVNVFIK